MDDCPASPATRAREAETVAQGPPKRRDRRLLRFRGTPPRPRPTLCETGGSDGTASARAIPAVARTAGEAAHSLAFSCSLHKIGMLGQVLGRVAQISVLVDNGDLAEPVAHAPVHLVVDQAFDALLCSLAVFGDRSPKR